MVRGTDRNANKSVQRPFDYTWDFYDRGKQIRILHGVSRECENNGLIILIIESTHPRFNPPSTIEYRIQGRTTPYLLRPPRNPFHIPPQSI